MEALDRAWISQTSEEPNIGWLWLKAATEQQHLSENLSRSELAETMT
jgi:hypothetical protein